MNIDEAQYLLIVIMALAATISGIAVSYKWKGGYVPVNYLFFVVFTIISMVIGHYYLALLLDTTNPTRTHVSIFGIRVARLIAIEVLFAIILLNVVSATYRSRYHKRLKELLEEEKYKQSIDEAIAKAIEAKDTAGKAR